MKRNDTYNERSEMMNVEKKNLNRMIQTFLRRGHTWSDAVRHAKNTLTIIANGHSVKMRAFVRVDD